MTTINNLPAADPSDIGDADLVVIYDTGAGVNPARKATRGDFLTGVAREGADVAFLAVEAASLTAPDGAIDDLTVAGGLTIGAEVQKILVATANVTFGSLAIDTSEVVTMTVTGATTGDFVLLLPPAGFPTQMTVRAWVSAANTVSILAHNMAAPTVSGATYSFKALVIRAA